MTAITEDTIILSKQAWLERHQKEEFIRQWNIIMAMPETSEKLKALDPGEVFDVLANDRYEKYLTQKLESLTIKGKAN